MLIKHLLIVGMVITGLILQYFVVPALERTSLLMQKGKGDEATLTQLRRRELRLTWLNTALGIAVLGLSALAGSL
jgi:hypothetical protein